MLLSWQDQDADQINGATTTTIGDKNAVKKGKITSQSIYRHSTYMNVWLASAMYCSCWH